MPWPDTDTLSADIHVHTIASGHAFGTIAEMLATAEERRMRILGIAEHGPSMDGAPHEGYFTMRDEIAAWPSNDVRLLFGCEANILDTKGALDLPVSILERLDFVIAGLHFRTPYDRIENSRSNNTAAMTAAISTGSIDVLSHPLLDCFPADIASIVEAAAANGVALEVNGRALRGASTKNLDAHRLFLKVASDKRALLILSSDSHSAPTVGDVTSMRPLVSELTAVAHLIVNVDEHRFMAWLEQRRKRKQ